MTFVKSVQGREVKGVVYGRGPYLPTEISAAHLHKGHEERICGVLYLLFPVGEADGHAWDEHKYEVGRERLEPYEVISYLAHRAILH